MPNDPRCTGITRGDRRGGSRPFEAGEFAASVAQLRGHVIAARDDSGGSSLKAHAGRATDRRFRPSLDPAHDGGEAEETTPPATGRKRIIPA